MLSAPGHAIEIPATVGDEPAFRRATVDAIGLRAETVEHGFSTVRRNLEDDALVVRASRQRRAVEIALRIDNRWRPRLRTVGAVRLRAETVEHAMHAISRQFECRAMAGRAAARCRAEEIGALIGSETDEWRFAIRAVC